MNAIVTTENASLDLLSVTIKTLHVSGKQMTLAVFRQLPETCLYFDTGELDTDYSLWGLVRYQIKDSGDTWVVCSKDGVLHRADTHNGDFYRWKYGSYISDASLEAALKGNNNKIIECDEDNKIKKSFREAQNKYYCFLETRRKLLLLKQLFIAV